MGLKLANILAANRARLDSTAIDIMKQELDFISLHRELVFQLIGFEKVTRHTDLLADRRMGALADSFFGMGAVKEIGRYAAEVSNAFSIATEVCEYDLAKIKKLVNWPLMASDDLNSFATTRAHYEQYASMDYGPTQEWVVWYVSGESTLKVRAAAPLSRLYAQFPDMLTQMIMDHTGVRLSTLIPAVRPIFMMRATALEKYITKFGVRPNVQSLPQLQ